MERHTKLFTGTNNYRVGPLFNTLQRHCLIVPERLNDTPLTTITKKYQLNRSSKSTLMMNIIDVRLVVIR